KPAPQMIIPLFERKYGRGGLVPVINLCRLIANYFLCHHSITATIDGQDYLMYLLPIGSRSA
ncbi:MAG: hypothetical protein WCK17_07005, partial [Verrucomicrobiota bacterium]